MTLVVVCALVAAAYASLCAGRPFARCRVCRGLGAKSTGAGRLAQLFGRPAAKTCRWCGGSGLRLRWGRRAWNRFAKIRERAGRAAG